MHRSRSRSPRRATLLVAALLLVAGCGPDDTSPTAPARLGRPALAETDPGATSAAHALGKAIPMAPNAHQFLEQAVQGTGIRLPAGLPVRIVASGQIKRTPTDGLRHFCDVRADYCATIQDVLDDMEHTPLQPWGDETWFGDLRGYAQLAWDGPADANGNTVVFAKDEPVIRMNWPGGELWAGHTYWECYWALYGGGLDEKGDCWDMSGSWTISVVPDDGSETDPKTGEPVGGGGSAQLIATLAGSTPVGTAQKKLSAIAKAGDGSALADVHWYFIPDQQTDGPPPMAASRFRSSGVADSGVTHSASSTLGVAPVAAAAPAAVARASGVAPQRAGSAGAEQALTECENSAVCEPTVDDVGGKLVVMAYVHGAKYSAEAGVGDDPTLTCSPTVMRGEEAVCEVKGSPVPTVVKWQFRPTDTRLQPIELADAPTTTWRGEMATSGRVTVTIKDGTGTRDLTADIVVTPRSTWNPDTVHWTWSDNSPGSLSPTPHLFEELGETKMVVTLKLAGVVKVVSGGPNSGLTYFTNPPFTLKLLGAVNTAALSSTGEFHDAQAVFAPSGVVFSTVSPPCVRSQFPTYINYIWIHEGTKAREANSHVDTDLRAWNDFAKKELESIVLDEASQGDFWGKQFDQWTDRAYAYSKSVTDAKATNPLRGKLTCDFNFIY